jgi:hypothetical protein
VTLPGSVTSIFLLKNGRDPASGAFAPSGFRFEKEQPIALFHHKICFAYFVTLPGIEPGFKA